MAANLTKDKAKSKPKFNFAQLANDFKGLDPNDPGLWPLGPRIVTLIALFLVTLAAIWWFDWQEQHDTLLRSEAKEQSLREEWTGKKRQAVNLDLLKQQLSEINQQFGALLKQLPNRAEMDSLLQDINQAGLGRGLQFELFKPGNDTIKDFYAEMPIDVRVFGAYHDLGSFVADVAKLPRIVTLNDLALEQRPDGPLKFEAKAVTYRYLDEEELAAQRQKQQAENKPGGRSGKGK